MGGFEGNPYPAFQTLITGIDTKPTKNFQAKVMHPTFVNPVLRYQQKSRLN